MAKVLSACKTQITLILRVKQAKNQETKEDVAIKILDKEKIKQEDLGESIKKEVTMMKMINHRNIVKLKEVLASNSKIYLVLELITGGDLFDLIKGKLA